MGNGDKRMSDYLAKTIVDLVENDDWNFFENRNGCSAKLRRIGMSVFQRSKMPSMFIMHFSGKSGKWLRGGFWLTWDDLFKGITEILNQMGYEIVKRKE